ncbi:MAG: DEAD/DEAH box helicase family protein [Tissierellales bacterium]|nr:DEAD/DEAH box helicase family protein [Tissierellales bacterium]MBN2826934.1 DEAD/DEAH box helicase family protein [Tissierellales bacterium]
MNPIKVNTVNSGAEDLFVELFCEVFGPHKAEDLYVQHPFVDIYGEFYHDPKKVSENKYYDDLLKQNSLVYNDWKVYRWTYKQLLKQPEKIKDELVTFLGETPFFKKFEAFLPVQQGKAFELRNYQKEAVHSLMAMRENGETIALLYHATGIGKTVTACMDAKQVNGRTLFLVNALKLADQADKTFAKLWPEASRGFYTGSSKDKNADVIFATVQSISKNLMVFLPDSFQYIVVDECHHAASKTYQKIFSYFKPQFILGLSATPERSDGEDMLALFQNVAHKMDLKTAVEVDYFIDFYENRRAKNLYVENAKSLFSKTEYSRKDVEKLIFRNPFDVMSQMNFVKRDINIEWIRLNHDVHKRLTLEDITWILKQCDEKLESYYATRGE